MSLIGTYFYSIDYGCGDSHLVNFYKVVGETPKSVKIQRVSHSVVGRSGNLGYYDEIQMVVPCDDIRLDCDGNEPEIITKRLSPKGSIKFEYYRAYPWKGEPLEHYNYH